jgi:hypothetical protein
LLYCLMALSVLTALRVSSILSKAVIWHCCHSEQSLWMWWPDFFTGSPHLLYLFVIYIPVKVGDTQLSFAEAVSYRFRIHWTSYFCICGKYSFDGFFLNAVIVFASVLFCSWPSRGLWFLILQAGACCCNWNVGR